MGWRNRISAEFFPPQTYAGLGKMLAASEALAAIKPVYFSVTYGAGGSTQDKTLVAVDTLRKRGHSVAPHLSCIGATTSSIAEILKRYRDANIDRVVALRGDLPSGMVNPGHFHYAVDLIRFIRETHGDWFKIKAAAYPEYHPRASSPEDDIRFFCEKMNAGADEAITQYFYNPDAYCFFVDACRAYGVSAPIMPGVMPITNNDQLFQFSENCGVDIPRWLRLRFKRFDRQAREDLIDFGCDVVTKLCERLIAEGAPGLHFYSMNQSGPTLEICRRLGVDDGS